MGISNLGGIFLKQIDGAANTSGGRDGGEMFAHRWDYPLFYDEYVVNTDIKNKTRCTREDHM